MACILVVDDEATILSMIEDTLTDEGYVVTAVSSGTAALTWLTQHAADLLLCDQMMPGMLGAELCRQIQATPAWATMRIIMMSAAGEGTIGDTCHYDHFLRKPFTLDQLSAAITTVLARPH